MVFFTILLNSFRVLINLLAFFCNYWLTDASKAIFNIDEQNRVIAEKTICRRRQDVQSLHFYICTLYCKYLLHMLIVEALLITSFLLHNQLKPFCQRWQNGFVHLYQHFQLSIVISFLLNFHTKKEKLKASLLNIGGQGWIRTNVDSRRQISYYYSFHYQISLFVVWTFSLSH